MNARGKINMEEKEKLAAQNELNLLEKFINEKKVDRISNDEYNITIEVVAFDNLVNHISKRRTELEK
jgi:hypothetical protein